MKPDFTVSDQKDLAYDLRQYYAQIVGESLMHALVHRKNIDFYNWYKSLEDVKTVTLHKWKDQERSLKIYNELVDNIKKLANKYPAAWSSKSNNANEFGEIEEAIRRLEEFLYKEIERAKMFGEGYVTAGL